MPSSSSPNADPLRITVIVAVRNERDHIGPALDALLAQQATWRATEVVVVDGGSTDGTAEEVARRANHLAWWTSEPDRGVFDAWNKALDHATGDWITFLGADDRLVDDTALARVAPKLHQAAALGARFAYGPCQLYSWRHHRVVDSYNPDPDELSRTLRAGRFVLHAGTFHHRSLFDGGRRFNSSYRIAGDYAFLLAHLRDHRPFYLNEPVARMGIGGMSTGTSHRLNWRAFCESLRAYHEVMSGFPWRIYARWAYKSYRCLLPR